MLHNTIWDKHGKYTGQNGVNRIPVCVILSSYSDMYGAH